MAVMAGIAGSGAAVATVYSPDEAMAFIAQEEADWIT